MPHNLGLLAYIFAARKQIAGTYFRWRIFSREDIFARGYFREKIFSREDIFAGRYFRVNSIFAKISSRENISNSLFAKFSSRENKVLYSSCVVLNGVLLHFIRAETVGPTFWCVSKNLNFYHVPSLSIYSSFVYHHIILSTQFVVAMLWSLVQLRRGRSM